MRILLLSQIFDPEPNVKGLMFARELTKRGHEVEVLTGFPNYPGGKVYPGYRIRPWTRENIDGISILRVALYPSHDKSASRRVLNYLSFAGVAALLGPLLVKKPDIVYVYHPPATIGLAAAAIGFFCQVPFVYDVQDLWPDTVAQSGMMTNPILMELLARWCRFVYRRAHHIVVLSPGFKSELVRRGVPEAKVDVIYNWCDEAAIQPKAPDPELASKLGLLNRFNVMFAGTMGTAQALGSVLDAAALCQYTLPNVQFVLVGTGIERATIEKKAADLKLSNVLFLPHQPMSAMGNLLAIADVVLVHLKDHPLFRITIPSKTQAYMASGKPIIMGVRGDAANLVSQSGCGLICEPENARSIAEAVARFAAMSDQQRSAMGEAGKEFYRHQLSFGSGVNRFESIFIGESGLATSSRAKSAGA